MQRMIGWVRRAGLSALSAGLTLALTAGPAVAASPVARLSVRAVAEVQPPDRACRYHDPRVRSQKLDAAAAAAVTWPQERLRYQDAWQFSRGQGVLVAVVDSGVDAAQEQLRGAVREGYDVTSGHRTRGGTTDCYAHGTLVAGIIAARPVQGRSFAGVAPEADILPVRQTWGLDANANPLPGSADALIEAMDVAVDSGAQVVNVSITVPQASLTDAQRRRFGEIAQRASDRDVLIVTATGNRSAYQGTNQSTFPAQLAQWYGNVVAVSGFGPDGRPDDDAITGPFVTLTAPDQGMPCLMDHGGLVPCTGTSFAAPFVSGVAALIRSRFPDDSAKQVRDRLVATADHPARNLPDPEVGYGVVNPAAALTTVLSGPAIADGPASLRPSAASRRPSRALALTVAAGAVVLALIAGLLPVAVRLGRQRGWRPGLRSETGAPAGELPAGDLPAGGVPSRGSPAREVSAVAAAVPRTPSESGARPGG